MKIIVCAKQIRHTYARSGASPETGYLDEADSIFRVNPHDEAALELALRLKDQSDGTEVVLLTLGPAIAADELRRCLATGADHWVQLDGDGSQPQPAADPLDQPDPWIKAALLAKGIQALGGDLVLCGKASMDRGNGQVAALLARRLGRPFVSAITALSLEASGGIKVQRSAGRGVREMIACGLPAVCSVDLGGALRLPPLPRRQWAQVFRPQHLSATIEEERARLVTLSRFQPRPRPRCVPPPDSRQPAYDRVMQLLTGSTVEKSGEILTGSVESQVEGILTFLRRHDFLENDTNP
jgi:electron transfer flavoprotein beta subunit